jgi:AraC-like DNA-binding protein/mannose-6-phosphate isomerase-like protein (cupin superfamily)
MTHMHHYFTVGVNPTPPDGELAVLFSGEGKPHRSHKIGPAVHDYYLIHTVISGKGQFTIGGNHYTCHTGDTFIIFPGELFSYEADEHNPWQYVWVGFSHDGPSSFIAALGVSPAQPIIRDSLTPMIRSYYTQLQGCFQTDSPPALSNLEAAGYIRLLLHRLGLVQHNLDRLQPEASTTVEHVMNQAIQYLSLQFTQTISIEHLSNMLGYHRTHLCKLFKQTTGLSPMQYLLKIRMQRASELLLTSTYPIEQVASSVGYSDALYFSRKFRQWHGQSPTEYRNKLRGSL